MKSDSLVRFRSEFPILQTSTYLISSSLGAMPRAAARALVEYAETWATRGLRAWGESWWDLSVTVGDEIAPLLGAAPRSVTMLPSVTAASAALLSSFDYRSTRRRIVILDGEFPSNRYLYQALGSRLGAEVVTIPSPRGDGLSVDEERVVSSIDDRTAIVALSHVLHKSAFVVDVAPIAKKCRQVGALLVLDAYQSVGTMPVAVDALSVDVVVGGVVGWLCGGPGGAYLYVRPERRKALTPALTGWMAHPAPFAFEPPPMRYREDAFRFLLGTPAIPALYAAREGPKIVREAGIAAIREKSLRQTALVAELARRRGFRTAASPEPSRRGGMVAVEVPNALEVSRELNSRDIVVDFRPGVGIRLSPHFYTEDAEIDRAFQAIDEILSSRAWERWKGRGGLVT